uniref:Long-chain-fatty-acid--CoA ligase n=1 Tax=Chlamydomonas leiostraca TaxID=1034604 RepID=A0A7S0R5D9_9CHLO
MPRLEVSTLYELFTRSVEKFPGNECLGVREKLADGKVGEYKFQTYKEVGEQVTQLASGLRAIGVNPKHRVGILGPNCPEWMVAMQACNRMSMHCVPLYDSLGENAIEYIINHAEAVVAFVSTDKFPNLVKALDKVQGVLKSVVYWGPGNAEAQKAVTDMGYQLYSYEQLIKLGTEKPADPVPPSPEDLCTIMYTSGTTGDPKGVMLKHSAVVSGVANSWFYCKNNNITWSPPDRILSYLPLAHIFDRVNEELFLYMGCSIGYWQGDVTKLVEDIAALRPAMFIGVPRVFDRIYTGITTQIKNGGFIKSLLFNWGFNRKLYFLKQGIKQDKAAPFFDKLIFSKISQRLGGRVKAVVSGGAPLAPHVEEFLRTTMCALVVQGYGLTETCAASFLAVTDEWQHFATVGCPTPCTELRLESVPEMNYDALDPVEPKGEVLIRSPAGFSGYYKAQDKTDEVLERDGWFHTGDIGAITASGALKIIDRKKNIFKLAQGEYIAPEKIENVYQRSPLVAQVFVYGDSLRAHLVAVVVPDAEVLIPWAKERGLGGDLATLCASPHVREAVVKSMQEEARVAQLRGFEQVSAIHLHPELFTVDNELLTPTFKLKRPQAKAAFQPAIDAMYASLPSGSA